MKYLVTVRFSIDFLEYKGTKTPEQKLDLINDFIEDIQNPPWIFDDEDQPTILIEPLI